MSTVRRNITRPTIPSYSQNAVLQLIVASAVGFIAYHLTRVILLIVEAQPTTFSDYFTQNIALPDIAYYTSKFWTIFTYGWVHNGFWELFSNMLWLYCFGSLVQMMVGYRQVIPLFIYGLAIGGLFYEGSQLLPADVFNVHYSLLGAHAGVMTLAVAALTISPGYRFYLGEHFSIPIIVVAGIFFFLAIINSNMEGPRLLLLAGAALTGFGYIKLLQAGYKPGTWVYGIFERMDRMVTPDDNAVKKHGKKRSQVLKMSQPRPDSKQKRVDELLDKINQKGYDSLTKEEKDFLLKASNENDN